MFLELRSWYIIVAFWARGCAGGNAATSGVLDRGEGLVLLKLRMVSEFCVAGGDVRLEVLRLESLFTISAFHNPLRT